MTMALLLKAKNNIGTQRHESQRSYNDKYHHYKTRRKKKHEIGSQSGGKISERRVHQKDISHHRKGTRMNVGSRSNTATAATAKLGKNKRTGVETKGANKKSKDDTQPMEIDKTNDNQMIDDKEITTEVNARTFDISNWMLENEATTEQIAASKIPFTKTLGIGSIQEALTAFIKIPA